MKRYEVILTEAEMRRLKRISNEYIPVAYCADNKLTSLEGCPRKVGQNFDCLRNKKKFTLSDVKRYCKVHGKICCD